jgi:hypothetical protein
MSQTKALKVRVTLFCILVGIVLATAAVVTDHWAVLSPHLEHHNATCEAAHFGLWRICTTRVTVNSMEDKSCGRITLSGGNVPTLGSPPSPALHSFPDKLSQGKKAVSQPENKAATQPFLPGRRIGRNMVQGWWLQPG